MSDYMTAAELNEGLQNGRFSINKKGKIVENELLPDYENMINKLQKKANKKSIAAKPEKNKRKKLPLVYDNITFASKLEISAYRLLQESGLIFKYEPEKYVIAKNKKVDFDTYIPTNKKGMYLRQRAIHGAIYTADFVIYNKNGNEIAIIETKGKRSDSFKLRIRLFFIFVASKMPDFKWYFEPRNIFEIKKAIKIIQSNIQ